MDRRIQLRQANLEPWGDLEGWAPQVPANTDSSLKRITTFINKVRATTAATVPEVLADIPKLSLEKYAIELIDALSQNVAKSKSSAENCLASIEVISVLHQRLGATVFTIPLIARLDNEETGTQYTEGSKVRASARLWLDLFYSGIIPDKAVPVREVMLLRMPVRCSFGRLDEFLEELLVISPYSGMKFIRPYFEMAETFLSDEIRKALKTVVIDYLKNVAISINDQISGFNRPKGFLLSQDLLKIQKDKSTLEGAIVNYNDFAGLVDLDKQEFTIPKNVPPVEDNLVGGAFKLDPLVLPEGSFTVTWNAYRDKLQELSSDKQVKLAVSLFRNDPTWFPRLSGIFTNNPLPSRAPFMAKFLAAIASAVEPLVTKVIEDLTSAINAAQSGSDARTLIVFYGELVKMQVISPHLAMDMVINFCTPSLKPEDMYSVAQACGAFMAKNDAVLERWRNLMDVLKRQTLFSEQRIYIDGAQSYLEPTAVPEQRESAPSQLAIHVLISSINTSTQDNEILAWIKKQDQAQIELAYSDLMRLPQDYLPALARSLAVYHKLIPSGTARVVDTVIEELRRRIAEQNIMYRQATITAAMYLAELRRAKIVSHGLISQIFDEFLATAESSFRTRLVCTLLLYSPMRPSYAKQVLDQHADLFNRTDVPDDLVPLMLRTEKRLRKIAKVDHVVAERQSSAASDNESVSDTEMEREMTPGPDSPDTLDISDRDDFETAFWKLSSRNGSFDAGDEDAPDTPAPPPPPAGFGSRKGGFTVLKRRPIMLKKD